MTGPWRVAGAVAALVATALAVGLTQGGNDAGRPAGTGSGPVSATDAARPSTGSTPTTPVSLTGTDDAFIQLVIPMDEGVLAMIDHLDGRPAGMDPSLRALAGEVRAAHRVELRELRGLLAAGHLPELNVHEGHQMPGMVTDDNLAELRAATDEQVWPRAVALLRAHLEQTVVLCRGVRSAGGSPELRLLAGRIQQARAAELGALQRSSAPRAPTVDVAAGR
ncbi:DUF305 domain-containing protein [Micromonospora orduensis]|uniref:DUF305 domain-containing protein n=1 Tax=Micromonospora orduensis TaxID=1420891 RepID=UPI00363B2784